MKSIFEITLIAFCFTVSLLSYCLHLLLPTPYKQVQLKEHYGGKKCSFVIFSYFIDKYSVLAIFKNPKFKQQLCSQLPLIGIYCIICLFIKIPYWAILIGLFSISIRSMLQYFQKPLTTRMCGIQLSIATILLTLSGLILLSQKELVQAKIIMTNFGILLFTDFIVLRVLIAIVGQCIGLVFSLANFNLQFFRNKQIQRYALLNLQKTTVFAENALVNNQSQDHMVNQGLILLQQAQAKKHQDMNQTNSPIKKNIELRSSQKKKVKVAQNGDEQPSLILDQYQCDEIIHQLPLQYTPVNDMITRRSPLQDSIYYNQFSQQEQYQQALDKKKIKSNRNLYITDVKLTDNDPPLILNQIEPNIFQYQVKKYEKKYKRPTKLQPLFTKDTSLTAPQKKRKRIRLRQNDQVQLNPRQSVQLKKLEHIDI